MVFTCPQAVAHRSTNRARRTVTSQIGSDALPLHHATNPMFKWLRLLLMMMTMIMISRLVVLESGLGLEFGLKSVFAGLGLGLGP